MLVFALFTSYEDTNAIPHLANWSTPDSPMPQPKGSVPLAELDSASSGGASAGVGVGAGTGATAGGASSGSHPQPGQGSVAVSWLWNRLAPGCRVFAKAGEDAALTIGSVVKVRDANCAVVS